MNEREPVYFFIYSCRNHCLIMFLSSKHEKIGRKTPLEYKLKCTEKHDALRIDENQNNLWGLEVNTFLH